MLNPKKLETRLRTIGAGIAYPLLFGIEAIGFPTFGLLLLGVGVWGLGFRIWDLGFNGAQCTVRAAQEGQGGPDTVGTAAGLRLHTRTPSSSAQNQGL